MGVVASAHAAQRACGEGGQRLDRRRHPLARVEAPEAEQAPVPRPLVGGGEGARVDPRVHDRRRVDRQAGGDRALAQIGADEDPLGGAVEPQPRRHAAQRPGHRGEPRTAEGALPAVDQRPVGEPLVDHHADRGQAHAAGALEQRHRHPAHRPPGHRVGLERGAVAVERAEVVALDPQPLADRQRGKLVVAPVPPQLAVDVRALGDRRVGRRLAMVGGQHPHHVARGAQLLHAPPPEQLVPALVVRRVHVADREHAHRAAG